MADFVGNASEKHALYASETATSNDDHIDGIVPSKLEDFSGWIALKHDGLDILNALVRDLLFRCSNDSFADLLKIDTFRWFFNPFDLNVLKYLVGDTAFRDDMDEISSCTGITP